MAKRVKQQRNPSTPKTMAAGSAAATGHDEIAERAYFLWQQRGCPVGSPEEDWSRAEADLQDHNNSHGK